MNPSGPQPPRLALAAALVATPFLLSFGCQEGNSTVEASTDTAYPAKAATLAVDRVTHGFGQLLPHRAFGLDASGNPGQALVDLRTVEDVLATVSAQNPVLPAPQWPTAAILPTGQAGNHFVAVEFTSAVDPASVLDASPSAPFGLSGAVEVVGIQSLTGQVVPIAGRAFVDGWTPDGGALAQWVGLDGGGQPVGLASGGVGFPGTQSVAYPAGADLVNPRTLVFVADSDGDLSTHETFPAGVQVTVRVSDAVQGAAGEALSERAVASATVGADTLAPEVAFGPLGLPDIVPASGATDVDVQTTIQLGFTEPVQPFALAGPAPAVTLSYGSLAVPAEMPFQVQPLSALDLTRYELVPASAFPGSGSGVPSTLGQVHIQVHAQAFTDLGGTLNQLAPSSFFTTGNGPGLVNAPVAPDAIYVARAGGISVVDLNGFGQGTGNPTFDPANPVAQGNSNFPNNPNVWIQGALLVPPLAPGTGTHDGGSEGVFSLTKDSNLQDLLASSPLVESVADMMLGQPLDGAFNNGPPPFGCQSGGGNLCASSGLKLVTPVMSGASIVPAPPGQFPGGLVGAGNLISWAPHPNPPPLTFPPLCVSPMIGGQEPTTQTPTSGLINLLIPGANYLGDPVAGTPPTNLLSPVQNTFFTGPSSPQAGVANCAPFQIRQQIGHFLYVADPARHEVVVFNSNRMTVIDRIPMADPRSFAMSPNLDFLAVSNTRNHTVDFIDINPVSATFHQIVKSTPTAPLPGGIAWQPDNEDILVCHERAGSVSILSAFSLDVRKTVTAHLDAPFEVAVTSRHMNHGLQRQTYFAFILDRNGKVALFESGPDGINGWGNDDVIGAARFTFENPRAVRVDSSSLGTAVWIAHERALDATGHQVGAPGTGGLTLLELQTSTPGVLPLATSGQTLAARDLQLRVKQAIGASELTGIPTSIAMDNQRNLGGLPNPTLSGFAAGVPAVANGKNLVRTHPSTGAILPTNAPTYALITVASSSTTGQAAVDVIDLGSGQRIDTNPFAIGIQSIPIAGALGVMDYFKQ